MGEHPERLSFRIRSDQDLWNLLTSMTSSGHCACLSGHPRCPTPFSLGGMSVCSSKPSSYLQTIPGHLQKRVVSMHSLLRFYNSSLFAIITYLLALVLSSLDWKFPQGQASCLLVSCPARGQAHSRRGEHGTLGSGKSTAISGCCLFMRWTFWTLPGRAQAVLFSFAR